MDFVSVLGLNPFAAERFFPASVFGPVDIPPWNLHRPFAHRSVLLHGHPPRVLAPQVISMHSGG